MYLKKLLLKARSPISVVIDEFVKKKWAWVETLARF